MSSIIVGDDTLEPLESKSDFGRVLFGFLLCYYRYYGSFPQDLRYFLSEVWAFLCRQLSLSVSPSDFDKLFSAASHVRRPYLKKKLDRFNDSNIAF